MAIVAEMDEEQNKEEEFHKQERDQTGILTGESGKATTEVKGTDLLAAKLRLV